MFFVLSKIAWFFLAPTNFFIALLLAGAILLFTRWKRTAAGLIVVSAALFAICGPGPAGSLLALPLENRFPRPAIAPSNVAGIIVLGGAIDPEVSGARGEVVLSQAGTRLTEAAVAAKRFPRARVIFTGGSGHLAGKRQPEAQLAGRILVAMGVSDQRITLEDHSRNTWQNAVFTRDIVHPAPDQKWLLITSAVHMPRAMGVFRKAGFDVVPWPAGYLTAGSVRDAFSRMGSAVDGLDRTDLAIHEWVGLVVYRMTGRTSRFLPAP